ncbi:MAG: TetR/AcrR family transcriptional regulator [Fibrobacter sp.]|jgi:AcrR family transcriptional regulator|nr:TetR/AcrR family transcriptional regulator [Fibrobacter sp.]
MIKRNNTKKTEPRWERKKDARPKEIIAAAHTVFVEKGYSATRVELIAAKAGVTAGTLYVYFENKEDLLKTVVREAIKPILSFGHKFVEEFKGTPEELVHILVHTWWDLMEKPGVAGIPKLMTAESTNFPELGKFYAEEVLTHAFRIVKQVLNYGIRHGKFKIENVDMMARVIMGSLHELTVNAHSFAKFQPAIDISEYLKNQEQLILRGIT